MVFCSPVFLFLFLPALLGLYFVVPRACRNFLLLLASLLCYAWGEQEYLLILLTSIVGNYLFALAIQALGNRFLTGSVLAVAVLANLGLLATFKYANFLADNLNLTLAHLHVRPVHLDPIHLPLGISFFTFHALSYVIDVARRQTRALKNPVDFALYIAFFPQAFAGPIVRYREIAVQLTNRWVSEEGFALGVRRFITGLAKKMLIANTLAGPADAIFGLSAHKLTPGLAWLGIVCYTLQIYLDFSGYSDMAIGLARMFGFRFPENFRYPYAADSVTDFWRRWHISLSTWFRDYLYIPLGGNRCGAWRTYFNLVLVFFLCGLWHGASWTFIVWGLFHGAFLVLERAFLGRWLDRCWTGLRGLYTLLAVMAGWVLFRAGTLAHAGYFLKAMAGHGRHLDTAYRPGVFATNEVLLALLVGVVAAMPTGPFLAGRWRGFWATGGRRARLGAIVQPVVSFGGVAIQLVLLLVCLMNLAAKTYNPFIYFRF